jgi:hypothetical protein
MAAPGGPANAPMAAPVPAPTTVLPATVAAPGYNPVSLSPPLRMPVQLQKAIGSKIYNLFKMFICVLWFNLSNRATCPSDRFAHGHLLLIFLACPFWDMF